MNEQQIESLVAAMEELGFKGRNMYGYLEECIEAQMPEIPFYQRKRIGEDEIGYDVALSKNPSTGLYYPDNYAATLLRTHPIAHGNFEEIDTAQLEKEMKTVNWQEFDRVTNMAGEQNVHPILERVFSLGNSDDMQARDISARLQLRYWLYTPVEQRYNVGKYYDDYSRSHLFTLGNGFTDIHAREAYNLLCGRGVLKFSLKPGQENVFHAHWKVLEGGHLKTLPDYHLNVKVLPIREIQDWRTGPSAIYNLIRGERIQVHFMGNSDPPVFMEADPRNRSFAFYDTNHQKIENKDIPGMDEFEKQARSQRKQQSQNKKGKGRSL